MAKKTTNPGTHSRKNKVFKRPFDLTGINKVIIVGKCPVGKRPTSKHTSDTSHQPIIYQPSRQTTSTMSNLAHLYWFKLEIKFCHTFQILFAFCEIFMTFSQNLHRAFHNIFCNDFRFPHTPVSGSTKHNEDENDVY